MKLYITGSPGSGKSTLAREISRITGIKCVHLDEVMHEPDPDNPGDDRKRDPDKRDRLFQEIISGEDWIIEDAGRKCFREGQERADRVIVISLPKPLLFYRVARRWLRQNIGIEYAPYNPDLTMLQMMRKWVMDYDICNHVFCPDKAIILKSRREVRVFLTSIKQ